MRRRLIAAVAASAGILALLRASAPPILAGTSFSRAVYDREDRLLRLALSGDDKYRLFTRLDDVSPALVEAFLLREDRGFYWHPGVNPGSLARAAIATIRGRAEFGDDARLVGGSTITMQLARIRLGLRTRGALGKLRQIAAALWLEARHSKREILEAYLNLAPFGGNVEGVGAASLIAYRKDARDLTLPEALALATVPQHPRLRGFPSTALGGAGSGLVSGARMTLFETWLRRHPEDSGRRSDMALPLVSARAASLPWLAPHFVTEALRRTSDDVARVRTTLDLNLQRLVESKLKAYVASRAGLGVKNAAALLIDHQTMDVLAWVGSVDWSDASIQGQVNGALAKRSPGSSIKPLIYAQAFDQGLIHPNTVLKDTRMSFGSFDPENFDRDFHGPIAARDALVLSRNVPAVYLASLLKEPTAYECLRLAGISKLRDANYYGLSVALGGAEATMEEMIRIYAALAERGTVRALRTDRAQGAPATLGRIASPEASFLTLNALKDNPRPEQNFDQAWTARALPVAWKTGTSHGYRDAWAIGVFGHLALAVWVGNFDNEPNPALIGRDMAGPLFFSIVDGARDAAGPGAAEPAWLNINGLNVKRVKACAISGRLPGPRCQRQVETWFIPGKSPIKPCDVHREIWIARATGRRACVPDPARSAPSTFEFWPSDLLEAFRAAGIPRRPPPPFETSCRPLEIASQGLAPLIASPKLGLKYALRSEGPAGPGQANVIPFYAVADGDVRRLSWFVGRSLVGQGAPTETIFWPSTPGRHVVRVVDDHGRADARVFEVRASR